MAPKTSFFTGLTRRQWTGYILLGSTIFLLFALLYVQARRSLLNEIRHHAMGVATTAAAGLDVQGLQEIRGPGDQTRPAYIALQQHLNRIATSTPDIRYIYTMRRSLQEDARPSDYEYMVDAAAYDHNRDGLIGPDEQCEPPGKPYDAKKLPELINAWYAPSADRGPHADPPYPDLLSGYAPIRNENGQTVAIVGVDITADTVRGKLQTLSIALLFVWLLITMLIIMLLQLYYHQQEALESIHRLSRELGERNEHLTTANLDLAEANDRFKKEIRLAQFMQKRLLPQSFPQQAQVQFDQLHLTGDLPGGDFYDVFSLDEHHVALYMADVAGHGMATALVAGLLKSVFFAAREKTGDSPVQFQADLHDPQSVLKALNEMLIQEIPEYEFITMIYAVINLDTFNFRMARAGHPAPMQYEAKTGMVRPWAVPAGAALGLIADRDYPVMDYRAASGDKVFFFTDGLPGTLSEIDELFGEDRLMDTLEAQGHQPPRDILSALRQAVETHRGQSTVTDDYSLLVVEIR